MQNIKGKLLSNQIETSNTKEETAGQAELARKQDVNVRVTNFCGFYVQGPLGLSIECYYLLCKYTLLIIALWNILWLSSDLLMQHVVEFHLDLRVGQ